MDRRKILTAALALGTSKVVPFLGGTPAARRAFVDEDDDLEPTWLHDAAWTGGPFADEGATSQAIIDLTPGEWVLWGGGPYPPPVALTVQEARSAAGNPEE